MEIKSIIQKIGQRKKFKTANKILSRWILVIIPKIIFVSGIIANISETNQFKPKYAFCATISPPFLFFSPRNNKYSVILQLYAYILFNASVFCNSPLPKPFFGVK
jgi:hypothetical protein